MDVFNAQGKILANVLGEDSLKSFDNTLDVFPYVTRCTLDIMLEAAMGQQLGIQEARKSPYCRVIRTPVDNLLGYIYDRCMYIGSMYINGF